MSEKQFGIATLKSLFYRIEGFNELEEERQQQQWERTRFQIWWLVQRTKKTQLQKLTDIVKFGWEKAKKGQVLTKDDIKNFKEFDKKVTKIDVKKNWKEI